MGASTCSTRRRSSGRVTLRFAGSPGIAWTGMVQASSSAASSVNSRGPSGGKASHASRRSPRRAPWGVWAAARVERSTVPSTRPSPTRLSVSATGRTGRAAPWRSTASTTAVTSPRETSGRAPSWTRTVRSRPEGSSASRWRTPAATDCWRVVPPGTTAVTRAGSQAAARHSSTRSGAVTRTSRSTLGAAASASSVQASSGRPPTGAMSLSAPAIRRDDPAATTTASARGPPSGPAGTR